MLKSIDDYMTETALEEVEASSPPLAIMQSDGGAIEIPIATGEEGVRPLPDKRPAKRLGSFALGGRVDRVMAARVDGVESSVDEADATVKKFEVPTTTITRGILRTVATTMRDRRSRKRRVSKKR